MFKSKYILASSNFLRNLNLKKNKMYRNVCIDYLGMAELLNFPSAFCCNCSPTILLNS